MPSGNTARGPDEVLEPRIIRIPPSCLERFLAVVPGAVHFFEEPHRLDKVIEQAGYWPALRMPAQRADA